LKYVENTEKKQGEGWEQRKVGVHARYDYFLFVIESGVESSKQGKKERASCIHIQTTADVRMRKEKSVDKIIQA
jgi:hypothetical protein